MLNTHILEILLLAGFAAGFVDSIAGGGGLISLPVLLALGVPPHYALGTGKLASTMGSLTATRAFIKKRIFNPVLWKATIVATLMGAILGVALSQLVSAEHLKQIIPFVIVMVAVYMLFFAPRKTAQLSTPYTFKPAVKSGSIIGIILGCYDGFMGAGVGSFWTTTVMAIYKLDLLTASAVARVMNFVSNITALIVFALFHKVHYIIGLSMGIGFIIGTQIGAHMAIRFGAKFIKPIFLTVVLMVAGHLMWAQI